MEIEKNFKAVFKLPFSSVKEFLIIFSLSLIFSKIHVLGKSDLRIYYIIFIIKYVFYKTVGLVVHAIKIVPSSPPSASQTLDFLVELITYIKEHRFEVLL